MSKSILRGAALVAAAIATIAVAITIIATPNDASASAPPFFDEKVERSVWHTGTYFNIDSTLTVAGTTSYTSGLSASGGVVNLNASSNNATNINTGTSTGNVAIGSGTSTQSITISAGTGDLSLQSTDDVNMCTAASACDVLIGNATGATSFKALAGTGNAELESTGTGDVILDPADDLLVTIGDDYTLTVESAGGIITWNGTGGASYQIGTDDTVADDIDLGSAKDDVLISGEDITFDTADDADFLVADDFAFTMESAGGIWAVQNTAGGIIRLGTDDTVADTVAIGSAKDDVDVAGEDILMTTADDFGITSSSAGGIIDIDGTAGLVYSFAEDDTTADDIDIGSAKDDLDLEGEDITLDTSDDMDFAVADDVTFSMESAGGIWSANGTLGATYNLATDNTVADTVSIGSALDTVAVASATWGITGPGVASGLTGLTTTGTVDMTGATGTQSFDGAWTKNHSANNVTGSLPVLFSFAISAGAAATSSITMTHKVNVIDFWCQTQAAGGAGDTIQLKNAGNAISDAMVWDNTLGANDIVRAGERQNANSSVAAAAAMQVVPVDNGGDSSIPAGTCFVLAFREA